MKDYEQRFLQRCVPMVRDDERRIAGMVRGNGLPSYSRVIQKIIDGESETDVAALESARYGLLLTRDNCEGGDEYFLLTQGIDIVDELIERATAKPARR